MSQSGPVPVIAAAELRHELRTPLNHIIGYSEILLDEHPHAGIDDGIREIRAEADAMLAEIQRVAGQDSVVHTSAVNELEAALLPRIGRVRGIAETVGKGLPEEAQTDVNRICAATDALIAVLAGTSPATTSTTILPEPRPVVNAAAGRILVVDDNEMNRDMLLRQLERQHHEVATAPDGATALAMLRASRFDIMLLDLMMPGMNGFDVLAEVKRDPALSGTCVILVSALDEIDSVIRSIEAGAEDYLFKPVNPTLLRARINSTLDKMRSHESIGRKQRLESIGLLAAGIAHDFNNLLTGIIGHAQLLDQVLVDAADREMAQSIVNAGERAAELTRQLLAYSGKAMFLMQPLDISAVLHDAEGLINASLPKRARLRMNLPAVPPVNADKNQLLQALLNLSINGAEAIGTDCAGTLSVETGVEQIEYGVHLDIMPDEPKPGWYTWFEVRDDGCGMDAATSAKIFEPFFSTKFLGRGLGLAAVAGIVRSHKGMAKVTSTPDMGSAIRLYFPVMPGSEPVGTAKDALVVLVVDDEPVVRRIVKVALERSGRAVVLAESGESAIDLFRRMKDQVELVLLDWKMPVMDGAQTLARLREIRPDVKVIVSSGFSTSEAEESFREAGVAGYLQKPYRMAELIELINR